MAQSQNLFEKPVVEKPKIQMQITLFGRKIPKK